MSNFLKQGSRKNKIAKAKKHKKEFYILLGKIQELAEDIYETYPDIDEKNKESLGIIAEKFTGRELDNLELLLLTSKLINIKTRENEKENNDN